MVTRRSNLPHRSCWCCTPFECPGVAGGTGQARQTLRFTPIRDDLAVARSSGSSADTAELAAPTPTRRDRWDLDVLQVAGRRSGSAVAT